MNKKGCQINPYKQKITYESLKQDILVLTSIKNKYSNLLEKNNFINPKILLRTKKNNKKTTSVKSKCSNNNNRLFFHNIEKRIYKRRNSNKAINQNKFVNN